MHIVILIILAALVGLAVDCLIIGGKDPRKWRGGGKHGGDGPGDR